MDKLKFDRDALKLIGKIEEKAFYLGKIGMRIAYKASGLVIDCLARGENGYSDDEISAFEKALTILEKTLGVVKGFSKWEMMDIGDWKINDGEFIEYEEDKTLKNEVIIDSLDGGLLMPRMSFIDICNLTKEGVERLEDKNNLGIKLVYDTTHNRVFGWTEEGWKECWVSSSYTGVKWKISWKDEDNE